MPWTADFTHWQKQNQSCFLQDLPRASPRKWKWNKSWMPPRDTWCEQSGHWAELCSAKDCGENGHKYGTAGFVLLCLHKEFTTCIVPAMIKTWEGVSSASTVLFLTFSFGNFFFFLNVLLLPIFMNLEKKKLDEQTGAGTGLKGMHLDVGRLLLPTVVAAISACCCRAEHPTINRHPCSAAQQTRWPSFGQMGIPSRESTILSPPVLPSFLYLVTCF